MSDFYNGCGWYWRLIEEGLAEKSMLGLQKKFCEARLHRENCPACQRMNNILVRQLFGESVVVIGEQDATH